MKSDEAMAAEQAVEAKLASVGADRVRSANAGFQSEPVATEPAAPVEPEAAPAEATPEPPAEAAPEPSAIEEAPAATDEGDPAAAAVLAKYGGDPNKVAQAYAQLQRKLGEQGTELGAHREQSADYERLSGELEQLRAQVGQPQQFVDQATADWFDEAVLEQPVQALEWARANNNTLLMQRGMATWKDADPFAAGQYLTDLRLQDMEARLANSRPSNDAVELQSSLNQVLAEHPEFVQYSGDIEQVIGRYPDVAEGLTGDARKKQTAIETLFALAERDTLRSLALNGGQPAPAQTSQQVATPTTSETHPDEVPAPPSPVDKFRREFAEEAARYKGERAVPQAYVAR